MQTITDLRHSSLLYAVRALRRELLGFRLDYPVEIVSEAGPVTSCSYYLYSPCLFLDDLVFDEQGVALKKYRAQGPQYNPLFVAWWGLYNCEQYMRGRRDEALKNFLAQVQWLKEHAEQRSDDAVVWPCYFYWQEGRCRLESGWISAMYQGVVISTLIRAYRLTGDKELLVLSKQGSRVFEKSIEDGGVRSSEKGHVLYEEYPQFPLARVLDGFLFSLLGLYDLFIQTGDKETFQLFSDGIQGAIHNLDSWNYRDKWSWYGTHGYLCPPHYHKVNYLLLRILGNLTGEERLLKMASAWDIERLSAFDKAEWTLPQFR